MQATSNRKMSKMNTKLRLTIAERFATRMNKAKKKRNYSNIKKNIINFKNIKQNFHSFFFFFLFNIGSPFRFDETQVFVVIELAFLQKEFVAIKHRFIWDFAGKGKAEFGGSLLRDPLPEIRQALFHRHRLFGILDGEGGDANWRFDDGVISFPFAEQKAVCVVKGLILNAFLRQKGGGKDAGTEDQRGELAGK